VTSACLINTGSNPVLTTTKIKVMKKFMSKEEIREWIDRWSKLKPSPQRDMVIKIWSRLT
jgi:hypothetical protein